MYLTSFIRREIKFLLTWDKYRELLPVISAHMSLDPYCTDSAGYKIQNIYYDTATNNIIRHSMSKPYHKEKLRLRYYETPEGADSTVFLELKKKTDGIVSKRRATMTLGESELFLRTHIPPDRKAYLDRQILRELTAYLEYNDVKPAVYIAYNRIAFIDRDDKNVRLTFDYDLLARRSDLDPKNADTSERVLPSDTILMELKFSRAVPLWLSSALSNAGIFRTSFSKYGNEYLLYLKNTLGITA